MGVVQSADGFFLQSIFVVTEWTNFGDTDCVVTIEVIGENPRVTKVQSDKNKAHLALDCGGDGRDDAGLGTPPQRVPEQPGELGVTVRDVPRVFHESCDDTPKRQQTLVDRPSLTGPVVLGARP